MGNGKKGNVGADKITRIVRSKNFHPDGIELIRNPMPSQGGVDPETLEEVRQYSPQAFRKQERAVTESDYTDVLGRHPEVSKASAIFRWFGSWYTVLIAIDRVGAEKSRRRIQSRNP